MTMHIEELPASGPVIAVIQVERLEHAVPLAEALVAGGLRVLEVTLRTPVAMPARRAMACCLSCCTSLSVKDLPVPS